MMKIWKIIGPTIKFNLEYCIKVRFSAVFSLSYLSTLKAKVSKATPKVNLTHFHSCKHENSYDLDARIYGCI